MKAKKSVIAVVVGLACTFAASTAISGRAYEVEIGYFDDYGHLNGSITYPCSGGKWIEGELVGTPREIWSSPCRF
ncbi:MAG TPA: hypothetical protein VIG54_10330 [Lysobacter sp.]